MLAGWCIDPREDFQRTYKNVSTRCCLSHTCTAEYLNILFMEPVIIKELYYQLRMSPFQPVKKETNMNTKTENDKNAVWG
jgi:hypothetical protein